ncbi:MAG TPA: hypothetical protein VL993_09425 [Stellaceae bacterium]|nr:hypothetical protein [Stellaceae bacterium]
MKLPNDFFSMASLASGANRSIAGVIDTMSIAQKVASLALAALFAAGTAAGAQAETKWQAHHPRRVEVNHRLNRQAERIHRERKDGKITPQQAVALHREDRGIRHEERVAARHDSGHITNVEQHTFNSQENAVNRQIRGDATSGGGTQ